MNNLGEILEPRDNDLQPCRVQRGRTPVSGLCLIGDRAWVVRRGETEGGEYLILVHRPRKIAKGDKVKHRIGSLTKAEPKCGKPVRKED